MRKILLYFAIKYEGNYEKIYQAIKNKEQVKKEEIEQIEKKLKCNYITIIDPLYPLKLKSIVTPPIVLFYYGDINLLTHSNNVAIIGTRKNSTYGQEMTLKIVSGLKKYQANTVSGLATGIDGIGHQASIDNGVKTIAVLGSGIDYCYPSENKKIYEYIKENGLIISEYPGTLKPNKSFFLIRNRIIAAISEYIVVIEAKYKSGTMNTVAYGLEYGKEICCIPHLANEESGCNMLIKQGAKLIETAKDIYE